MISFLLLTVLPLVFAAGKDLPQKGCWKDTTTRGVGKPIDTCHGMEEDASLCYPYCEDGYTGVGPVCWQNCPKGYRDDGAYCAKPESYGRGTGYTSESSCKSKHSQGCETWGAIWYPKCDYGFYAFACCVCSPECPEGMKDIGVSCKKKSKGRGVGKPLKCAAGMEYDAGLCYTPCPQGLKGVGPVCWASCPKTFPYDCGALCVGKSSDCSDAVKGYIKDAFSIAVQTAKTIVAPTREQVSSLVKDSLNYATSFKYPVCK